MGDIGAQRALCQCIGGRGGRREKKTVRVFTCNTPLLYLVCSFLILGLPLPSQGRPCLRMSLPPPLDCNSLEGGAGAVSPLCPSTEEPRPSLRVKYSLHILNQFIHSFIHIHISVKHLQYVRHHARHWGYNLKKPKSLPSWATNE